MAAATCRAVAVPRNLSGAATTRTAPIVVGTGRDPLPYALAGIAAAPDGSLAFIDAGLLRRLAAPFSG
jgi:hypothetical protein